MVDSGSGEEERIEGAGDTARGTGLPGDGSFPPGMRGPRGDTGGDASAAGGGAGGGANGARLAGSALRPWTTTTRGDCSSEGAAGGARELGDESAGIDGTTAVAAAEGVGAGAVGGEDAAV